MPSLRLGCLKKTRYRRPSKSSDRAERQRMQLQCQRFIYEGTAAAGVLRREGLLQGKVFLRRDDGSYTEVVL